MEPTVERLFALYQRDGNPERLAQVFDRTAARLLKLAIHLAGDVAAAEDLVQATFVTAIERAHSYDEARALEPWLSGILANHARDLRRRVRRVPDVERIAERAEQTPLEHAQAAELSGVLAQALDRLPEPYRQTLILRLRHGMNATDIAHVHGESAATVRVRVHRGLALLRKALPASFSAGLLLLAEPARGLDAIREALLVKAAASAATGALAGAQASHVVIKAGGLVMSKKVMLGLVAVLLLIATMSVSWYFVDGRRSSVDAPAETKTATAGLAPAKDVQQLVALSSASANQETPRASVASAPAPELVTLRGKVIDGESGAALAGAEIELYPPRQTLYSDLHRRWTDQLNGRVPGVLASDSWPMVLDDVSSEALADHAEFTVYDPPLPGTSVLASAVSDARGEFELRLPATLGFLIVKHVGYATRMQPASRPRRWHGSSDTSSSADSNNPPATSPDELVVRMSRPHELTGYVVDTQGQRIERRLRLLFCGYRSQHDPARNEEVRESLGSWIVETGVDGSFTAELAADTVMARSLDIEWALTSVGQNPPWIFETAFHPGKETKPAVLIATRVPVLAVTDRSTGTPIEKFWCSPLEHGDLDLWWSGPFFARDGRLRLCSDPYQSMQWKQDLAGRHELRVWARGYRATTIVVDDLAQQPLVRAELEPGPLAVVEGFVLDRGAPVEGALVSLQAEVDSDCYPRGVKLNSLDALRTASSGAFRLEVPEGEYQLRAEHGDSYVCTRVRAPTSSPVRIEFDDVSASIRVRVRDEHGVPRAAHHVLASGGDKRNLFGDTDERGEFVFATLAPGKYRVAAPWRSTKWSFRGGEHVELELRAGASETVELVVPDLTPRFARVVVDRPTDFAGWRARAPFLAGAWKAIESDGTVPIDLVSEPQLDIESSPASTGATRRWSMAIPDRAPDGFEIHLELDGPSYAGVLLSQSTGAPLAAMRVTAYAQSQGETPRPGTSVLTDADGRFRIDGLRAERYLLGFSRDEPDRRASNLFLMLRPFKSPSESSDALTIRLPIDAHGTLEGATSVFSGRVRSPRTEPAFIKLRIESLLPVPDGTLTVGINHETDDLDEHGGYERAVLVAPRYRAHLYDRKSERSADPIEWDASVTGPRAERDFELP